MKVEIHAELISKISVRRYKRIITTHLVEAGPDEKPDKVVTFYTGTFRCRHGKQFTCTSTNSDMLNAITGTWYTMSNVTIAAMDTAGPYLGDSDTW